MKIPEGPMSVLWKLNEIICIKHWGHWAHGKCSGIITPIVIPVIIFILVTNCRITLPSSYGLYHVLKEMPHTLTTGLWRQEECSLPWPGDGALGSQGSPNTIQLPKYLSIYSDSPVPSSSLLLWPPSLIHPLPFPLPPTVVSGPATSPYFVQATEEVSLPTLLLSFLSNTQTHTPCEIISGCWGDC